MKRILTLFMCLPFLVGPSSQFLAASMEPEIYGVFGDVELDTNGTISEADLLAQLETDESRLVQVDRNLNVIPVDISATATSPTKILASWNDHKRKPVVLRQGNLNFGWLHAKAHNLTHNIIRMTTQQPDKQYLVHGTAHTYRATARILECRLGICSSVKAVVVRVAQDRRTNHGYGDTKAKGVITAYCENPRGEKRCPDWVRELWG